jgi:hypothetical protein
MGKLVDEIRRLSSDPGARRLAEVVESLQTRVDGCCPPAPTPAPVAPEPNRTKEP